MASSPGYERLRGVTRSPSFRGGATRRARNPFSRWLMAYYVYLLASKKYGTLYLGVTNDVVRRVYEHKSKAVRGFHHAIRRRQVGLVRGLRRRHHRNCS